MRTVLILSLSNLFIAIFMTESKQLKLTLHLVFAGMQNQVYRKDQLKDLSLLTFIGVTYSLTLQKSTLLIIADDTTSYTPDSKPENIAKLLEENTDKLSEWFSNNYSKTNLGKCHLLVNTTGNIRINVRNETISNNSNQKLLGIPFNRIFSFHKHVAYRFRKTDRFPLI